MIAHELSLLTRSISATEFPTVTAIEDDPIVGLIEGPTDLATNAEEILKQGMPSSSGWSYR